MGSHVGTSYEPKKGKEKTSLVTVQSNDKLKHNHINHHHHHSHNHHRHSHHHH